MAANRVLDLLERTGSLWKKPERRRRSRPRLDEEPIERFLRNEGVRIALHVFREQARIGDRRGSFMEAVRTVAKVRKKKIDTVKKLATRHTTWRDYEIGMHSMARESAELERRVSGMPDDVRRKLDQVSAVRLLALLRAHGIDGTCPRWLVDEVRRQGRDDYLSPK